MPRVAKSPYAEGSADHEEWLLQQRFNQEARAAERAAHAEAVANGTAPATRRLTIEVPVSTVAVAKMLATLSQEEDYRVIFSNAADQMVLSQAGKIRELLSSDDMPY